MTIKECVKQRPKGTKYIFYGAKIVSKYGDLKECSFIYTDGVKVLKTVYFRGTSMDCVGECVWSKYKNYKPELKSINMITNDIEFMRTEKADK